ncbi:hypothetical protein CRYUN_Cryun03dG0115400 [Craigia yunnanensis]
MANGKYDLPDDLFPYKATSDHSSLKDLKDWYCRLLIDDISSLKDSIVSFYSSLFTMEEKLSPSRSKAAELEHLLHSHPEIADAVVIPYPDEEAGQIPMAYVVRNLGSSIIEAQVAPYKKIQRVAFNNSIS